MKEKKLGRKPIADKKVVLRIFVEQSTVDLNGGEDKPQVARRRLVAHQKLETEPVQFGLPLVEILVAEDHAVGQLPVPLHQRLEACVERTLTQTAHLFDLGPNEVNVPLQRLFKVRIHTHSPDSPSVRVASPQ